MFGVDLTDILKNSPDIAKGIFYEITKKEQALYEKRIAICKKCPLYGKNSLGEVCDASKCYNPKTGELLYAPATNFICGCGCMLNKKSRIKNAECVLNKW